MFVSDRQDHTNTEYHQEKAGSVELFLSWLWQERNLKLWEKSLFASCRIQENRTLLTREQNRIQAGSEKLSSAMCHLLHLVVKYLGILKSTLTLSCVPSICERVTPRLSHANSAVVLSAVKVLMKFLELLPKDSDYYNMLLKKLAPPLVTLLSGEPEVQYVALRNINLIVQKR